MATRKTVKKGPPKAEGKIGLKPGPKAQQPVPSEVVGQASAAIVSTPKYTSIGDVMRASAKGALPRGAKFVIRGGFVQLRVDTKHTGTVLYHGDASEVARWGLRKAGLRADFAKGAA
jgi:hypothetical protein